MAEYDVIVVGAGPGGSAAAYFLASAGAKVLVLEKKVFPRAKTCGDGLTPRAVKVLQELGLEDRMGSYKRVRGLRVLGAGRRMEMDWPSVDGFPGFGLCRTRKELDNDIALRAASAGAEYLFGVEAVEPVFDDGRLAGVRWVRRAKDAGGGVTVVDRGEERAWFVVIADGASGTFARASGLKRDTGFPMGLAIRTYYRCDRDEDDLIESWLDLRKGDVSLPGYGWIFPMGDGMVNIGVGLLTTYGRYREVKLDRLQRWYIDILPTSYGIGHDSQVGPYQSGRLPMGASMRRPFGAGYLVIGDAAGFVNPFNGEGIAYALETAKIASGVLVDALRSGRDLADYHAALHDSYGAYYRIGRKFTKIIGKPAAFRALCQVGMRSQTLMEFVFQVLANLYQQKGGRTSDRLIRSVVKFAEQDISELRLPDIAPPPPAVAKAL